MIGAAVALAAGSAGFATRAQTLAPVGCPIFHCAPEATAVMTQPIVQNPSVVGNSGSLGTMIAQGCSGNGQILACIFAADFTTGVGQGTLKVLDASTLRLLWGSATAPNSWDLDINGASVGQVPLHFADGHIAAGDNSVHVLYDASGAMDGKLALGGKGKNYGLTPIGNSYGIVSQDDGVLTLVYLPTWQNVGVLQLKDPDTGAKLTLASSSAATGNTLYAVAYGTKTNKGFLFSVIRNPSNGRLQIRSTLAFTGKTGASPVVVTPAVSGLSDVMILLHAPGLPSDATPQPRLLGLLDTGKAFSTAWSITLAQNLTAAPTIDPLNRSLFYVYDDSVTVYQNDLLTGAVPNAFDIRAIGHFPSTFVLNGHLASVQAGTTYTLLLSGGITASGASNGEYAIAFNPASAPSALLWSKKLHSPADAYTAAWNLGPSSLPGVYCPIVVSVKGTASNISRVCDF